MNAIKLISWIHLLWGLSLIFLGINTRPFGQLEAFLVLAEHWYIPLFWVGIAFAGSGMCVILMLQNTARFHKLPILVPMAMLPQQVLLLISLFFAVHDVWYKFDDRIWYAGITQSVFAGFHTIGMYVLYKVAIIGRIIIKKNGADNARQLHN